MFHYQLALLSCLTTAIQADLGNRTQAQQCFGLHANISLN